MKNTEKNKNKWVEKVRYTLELRGKSEKTFHNYKSHINRFLNHFSENVEINKLSENKIADYEAKIKDLQGRAEEHLKNAQAAETIATIAQANAQKTQE